MAVNLPTLVFLASPFLGACSGAGVAVARHAGAPLFVGMAFTGAIAGMIGCWMCGFLLPGILLFASMPKRKGNGVLRVWQNLIATLVFGCWFASFFASFAGGGIAADWLFRVTGHGR